MLTIEYSNYIYLINHFQGTITTMPMLIDKLLNEGYRFATISEMIDIQEDHYRIKTSRYLRQKVD